MAPSSPTVELTVAATAVPILEIGRTWMMDGGTAAKGAEMGASGPFGFWVTGRAGFLGDVDADVVAAAIGFMAPELIGRYWANRPTGHSPMAMTEAYAESAATWGRSTLAEVPEADLTRLAELSEKVIAAALPSTGVLFAGWRNLAPPTDPAGRVTVLLNVLRELRGGAHLSAVHAVGLGPHGAIMSTDDPVRGGAPWAERFGWTDPHPAADPEARARAEQLTTEILRPAYAVLSEPELEEFTGLVTTVRGAIES